MISQQPTEQPAITLQDTRSVVIRPLLEADHAALMDFGLVLPEDDWLYLEEDLRNPDIIKRLVNAHAAENWRQLVALADNMIVGYTSIRRLPGWSSHVGDIQLVIRMDWRRSGLGTALALAIFQSARDLGVSKVVIEMLNEHAAGRSIFRRLGFRVEGTLSDHARDRHGKLHDMLILAYHVH